MHESMIDLNFENAYFSDVRIENKPVVGGGTVNSVVLLYLKRVISLSYNSSLSRNRQTLYH